MTHYHLAFELLSCFKSNTNYDKERCTAHLDACVCNVTNNDWKKCYNTKEKGTDKCYFAENFCDKVLCVFTRTEAWDNTVVFAQVVSNFNWIVLD